MSTATVTLPLVLFLSPPVCGFFATTTLKYLALTADSQTHQDITDSAIRQVAMTLMGRHTDQYPDPTSALNSRSFQQALAQFKTAVAEPDLKESKVAQLILPVQ